MNNHSYVYTLGTESTRIPFSATIADLQIASVIDVRPRNMAILQAALSPFRFKKRCEKQKYPLAYWWASFPNTPSRGINIRDYPVFPITIERIKTYLSLGNMLIIGFQNNPVQCWRATDVCQTLVEQNIVLEDYITHLYYDYIDQVVEQIPHSDIFTEYMHELSSTILN
ncbi:MAG: hypothetical protein RMM53_04285 [Bacteroidia bacterium]|nr:hypothetical protein [Bacteroidia bacterium]MDW8333416.1 hypothetical protein [Bacteroidia bacterium]